MNTEHQLETNTAVSESASRITAFGKDVVRLYDLAEEIHISRTTAWKWATQFGLRISRIGRVSFVRRSDFEDFLQRHSTRPRSKRHVDNIVVKDEP